MDTHEWSEEEVFIDRYRKQMLLWDPKDYLNKLVRNYAWNDIANRTEKKEDEICTDCPSVKDEKGKKF